MPGFRYQALEPLPSPGVSRAFLGLAILDESRAEPVVLIWVPDELARDIEKSERVQRDTERAALLEHPHIIRVYGFGRLEDGKLARVVEFADGENLRRVLDKAGPLPPELAARLIADAAQGVHYAHLAGNDDGTPLLHGDLRPDTLLVSYRGLSKVSGYGATAFAPKESAARNLRLAPEQVLGGRAAMNVQTDVYLLGAALFECLTGKAPFEGEADFEQAVLSKELDLSAWPQVPDALRPVIARAMAKRAADRYPSALLLREAIELALQPLRTHEEIGQWLLEHFPDVDGTRAERQRILDKGIAAFARAQWSRTAAQPASSPFPPIAPPPAVPSTPAPTATAPAAAASAPTAPAPPVGAHPSVTAPVTAGVPSPVPAPTPVATTPPATAPSSAAAAKPVAPSGTASSPAAPRSSAHEALDDAPPRKKSPVVPVVLVLLVLAAVGAWWALRPTEPATTARAPEETTADAGTVALLNPDASAVASAVGAVDSGTAEVDAGALPSTSAAAIATSDAGTDATSPSVEATNGARGTLALTVEPSVTVEVDGVAFGRTPIKAAVAPGRRRVRLFDRAKGVDVTRFVTVSDKGVTSEQIFLQKGFVSVTAPPGAIVEIDGKNVGKAPIRGDLTVYEGSHSIVVTMGKAKWRDAFTVKANQRVYFDVGPQYE